MIDKGNYYQYYQKGLLESDTRVWKEEKVVGTITTTPKTKIGGGTMKNLTIRRLTPREVFRLMGVKDEDYEKVAKNQSESSLYHLAGDSICTSCLMAIFGNMVGVDWKDKVRRLYEKNSTSSDSGVNGNIDIN